MDKTNAWNKIPLEDYEQHMKHESVGQSQLLNMLTHKYLSRYNPENPLFLGISGGNGLEHVDVKKAKTVFGVDVNQAYLDETQKRYGEIIKQLVLVNTDISTSEDSFLKADFVWAALIFEYVELEKGLDFIANNTCESAKLIITIQSNNGNQSVSQTGVESIKSVKEIFNIVNKENLQVYALKVGFELIGSEENVLPNGKSFFTLEFGRIKS